MTGEIPEVELTFCQKIAELAKEHGVLNFSFRYEVMRHDDPGIGESH